MSVRSGSATRFSRGSAGPGIRPGRVRSVLGFTLAELTVVLFVMGMAAALTLPRIDTARYRLDQALREVHSVLLRAQRQAVLLQHDVVVRFDAELGRVTVHQDRNNNGVVDGGEPVSVHPLPGEARLGRRDVPTLAWGDRAIGFTDERLTFHRNGSSSAEGGLYLSSVRQIEAGGHPEETRALQVVRSTGSARCLSYRSDGWVEGCR